MSGIASGQSQVLAQAYANCGSRDPGGNPQQAGVYAEYYAGYFNEKTDYFSTRAAGITRIDAQLNFPTTATWSAAGSIVPPAAGTSDAPNTFSVRERGEVYLPQAGTYTFYLTSDDGSYLWIDGDASQQAPAIANVTINNGGGHASRLRTGTVTTTGPGWHNLQLLYGDSGGTNNLTLEYSGPGIGTAATAIPSASLCTGIRLAPTSLSYSPNSQTNNYMVSGSSGTPTLGNSNSTAATYALAAGNSLPAGITINPATGVLTADATVLPGSYSVGVAATNDAGTSTFPGVFTFLVNAPCGGLDPYGNTAQQGLLAEYYAGYFNDKPEYFPNNTAYALNTTQNPARLKRVESTLNYTTNGAWQASGLNLFSAGIAGGSDAVPTQFSARYRGKLYISTRGDYTFTVISDDASALVVDGSAAAQTQGTPYTVSNTGTHSATSVSSAATTLEVGWHDLALLYGNAGTNSYLSLQYSGPGISKQVIPSNLLCTGIESVPTGLRYAPGSSAYAAGSAATSAAPTVYSGNASPVTYAIGNASSLPAGITINPTTGVLMADATLVPGTYTVSVSATNTTSYGTGTAAFASVYVFTVLAPGCTGTDAGGNSAQAGLYSEYYATYFGATTGSDTDGNLKFFTTNTPKLTAVAPGLNFTANGAWSAAGLNLFTAGIATTSDAQPTQFSARYRGRIYIGQEGDYTFYLNSDDATYLFLDAAATASTLTIASATVNNGGVHSSGTTKQGTKHLLPGLHDIQVLYGQNPTDSYLALQYSGVSGATTLVSQQVIPSSVLCTSSTAQPLPVALVRFGAQATAQVVTLSWTTASELHSARFEIERSADGLAYSSIAQVAAAGASTQARQYQLLDRAPLPGLSYYRLRQVDLDGTATYSPVATVQRAVAAPTLRLTPNPSSGQVLAQLVQGTAAATTLQVLDVLGREVFRQELPAATDQHPTLDLHHLPAGVYLVRATSAAGVATQRLVRE